MKTKNQELLAKSLDALDAMGCGGEYDRLVAELAAMREQEEVIIDEHASMLTKAVRKQDRVIPVKPKKQIVTRKKPDNQRVEKLAKAMIAWNQANTIPNLSMTNDFGTDAMMKGFLPGTKTDAERQRAALDRYHQARACRNALHNSMQELAKANVPSLEAVKFQQDVEAILNNPNVDPTLVMREMERAVTERCANAKR